MKDSAKYARRIRPLLSGAKRAEKAEQAEQVDKIRLLLRAVLEEDATSKQAAEGMAVLEQEFVDLNELRVSPPKDIVERLGRNFPNAQAKASGVTTALNAIFDRTNTLSLEYLAKQTKRDVRKTLREEFGLSLYAESVLTLYAFDGHAMPVDNLLLEALKLDKYIHPGSDMADLQGFLERIILSKHAVGAHEALRAYATKACGRVARELARRAKKAAAAMVVAEPPPQEAARTKKAAGKKAKTVLPKKAARAAPRKATKKARKATTGGKPLHKRAKK